MAKKIFLGEINGISKLGIINGDSDFQEVIFEPNGDYQLQLIETDRTYRLEKVKIIETIGVLTSSYLDVFVWQNEKIKKNEVCMDIPIDKILQLSVLNKPKYRDGILVKFGARLIKIKFSRYEKINNNDNLDLKMCVYEMV